MKGTAVILLCATAVALANGNVIQTLCGAGNEGLILPHENCNQFYVCTGGLPVALTCPANLVFNPSLQVCDWPNNVNCGNRVVPSSEKVRLSSGNIAETICGAGNEGLLLPHETCSQFYVCTGGLPVALSCPANLVFNPSLQVCDWPNNVNCGNRV